MKRVWSETPFIRILIPLSGGILTGIFIPVPVNPIYFLLGSGILLITVLTIRAFSHKPKFRWVFGSVVNLFLLCAGLILVEMNTQTNDRLHYSHYLTKATSFIVKITKPIVPKEKTVKAEVRVMSYEDGGDVLLCNGKTYIYLKRDSNSLKLKYGDELALVNNFREIGTAQNPYEFDYKRFAQFHNIYHQSFLNSGDWKFIANHPDNIFFKKIYQVQAYLLSAIQREIPTQTERGVFSALMLGYTVDLNEDVVSAYANTGTLHVLAVSGMHVALIFWILNLLLGFMDKNRWSRILKAVLITFFIFGYACLTGFCPSVLRAGLMIITIILGRTLSRDTNIYNTIACSAFSLLYWNPFLITDAGFQLSYLAVVGIVFLQPKIYRLLIVRNWLINQIWLITSVSLAAQIATFPLSLFYFHQFPVYFFISNLIAIPLTTLIIYLGILFFCAVPVSTWLTNILGKLIYYLTQFTDWVLFKIEGIPHALIKGIALDVLETILLYTGVCLVIAFLITKRRVMMPLLLSCFILFFSLRSYSFVRTARNTTLIIYNVPHSSAVDFINGHSTLLMTDSSVANDANKIKFYIEPNWWANHISIRQIRYTDTGLNQSPEVHQIIEGKGMKFYQFANTRIVIIDKSWQSVTNSSELNVDYIILSHNPDLQIQDLKFNFTFKRVIFDSSNSRGRTDNWISECKALHIPYHAVLYDKAFVAQL